MISLILLKREEAGAIPCNFRIGVDLAAASARLNTQHLAINLEVELG